MTVQPLRVCLGLTLALEQVSRRGVGGDVWICITSITSNIKVKPPLGSAPLLLGGMALGRGGTDYLFIKHPLIT